MKISKDCLSGLKCNLVGFLTILLFIVPHMARGGGLTVEPGGLLLQKVPLGKVYDLHKETGMYIKVYNSLDRSVTYRISAQRPSEGGSGRWMVGYEEIPDPDFLSFDRNEVVIEPEGVGEVNLSLKLPDEPRYYNQHWAITVAIEGQPAPGEAFALAAYLPFEIETESRTGTGVRPWGKIGVEPSSLTLKAAEKGIVRIYNNEGRGHKYRLLIGVPAETSSVRQTGLTPDYRDVPDVNWIDMSHKEFAIQQNGVQDVSLTARLPYKSSATGPWETFLWVESDSGEKAFVRVYIVQ